MAYIVYNVDEASYIFWNKVKNAEYYDIRFYSDKKCKKEVKKIIKKKNDNEVKITFKKKYKKIYMKIRPYKITNGKKVYGRWSTVSSY